MRNNTALRISLKQTNKQNSKVSNFWSWSHSSETKLGTVFFCSFSFKNSIKCYSKSYSLAYNYCQAYCDIFVIHISYNICALLAIPFEICCSKELKLKELILIKIKIKILPQRAHTQKQKKKKKSKQKLYVFIWWKLKLVTESVLGLQSNLQVRGSL